LCFDISVHQGGAALATLLAEIASVSSIQSQLTALCERVERLENDRARTKRGHVNQRRAAEYLGKSREWLRQHERRGDGPRRNSDNTYSLDELDRFKEAGAG
jgi:hypothetical protein